MTTRLTPSSPAELKQRVLYITLIAAGANFIAVLEYIYFAYTANAWQMYVLAFNTTLLAFTGIVGAVLARRGQSERGIQFLLTAGAIAFGVAPFFVSGLGAVYGGGIAVLVAMIAWQTLPNKQAREMTVWGIVAGLVAFSTDLTELLSYRFPAPSIVGSGVFLLIVLSVFSFGYYNLRAYRNYNLQSKLIIILLGVIIFSTGTIALTTNLLTRAGLTRQVGSAVLAIAKGQATEVGVFINSNIYFLKTLSLNQGIDQEITRQDETRTSDLAEIQKLDQQWVDAVAQADQNNPLIEEVLQNDIADELREFQNIFPDHVEVFITDRYGALIAATNQTTDYYQADETWWQSAYNQGEGNTYIGNPEFDESSQTSAFIIAIPVYEEGASEKVVAILRSTLDTGAILRILQEAKFGQTGQVELRFPTNELLSQAVGGGFERLLPEDIEALKRVIGTYGDISYKTQDSLVSQVRMTTHDEKTVQFIEGLNWQVIVHQDAIEAYAVNTANTQTTLLIMLGVLGLSSGLVLVVARLLTSPIFQLTRTAEAISAGNFDVKAEVQTGDEIGVLADTFNNMTAQLRSLVGGLEQRVAERTKALATSTEVSRRLSTILNQGELVREVVNQIQQAFDYYHVHIYLWDAKRENLLMAGGTGEAGRLMLESGHFIPAERGLVGRAAELGTVVLVPDVTQTIGWLPNPLLPDTKAEVAVPIRLGETVLGVLDVQQNTIGGLSQNDADLLLAIANQVAIALQNAQAYAIAQRQANLEAQRNEIIKKIQNTTTIEDALKVAVRELGRATDVSKTLVRLNQSSDSFPSQ